METLANIEMDPAFGHWLAGFIAGEGCFSISRNLKTNYYNPRFTIHLRDDDKPILEEIQTRLGGIGHLHRHGVYGNSKPQVSWRVDSKGDCLTFVHVMDQFSLRAKKAKDYSIWRRAIFAWNNKNILTSSEGSMMVFFDQLKVARNYANTP